MIMEHGFSSTRSSTVSVGVALATCTLPGHSIRQKKLTLRAGQEQLSAVTMARLGTSGTDSWICGDSSIRPC